MKLSQFADNEILKQNIGKLLKEGLKADAAEEIMSTVKSSRESRETKEDLKEVDVEQNNDVVEEPEIPNDTSRANRYLEEDEIVIEEQDDRSVERGDTYIMGSGVGPKELLDTIRNKAKDATYSGSQTISQAIAALSADSLAYVNSVFGRSGNVIAQSGDYDASQIVYGSSEVSATLSSISTNIQNVSADLNIAETNIESLSANVVRITSADSPHTLDDTSTIVFANPLSGTLIINLPPGTDGRHFRITNTGDNTDVSAVPNGSEKLFGDNSSFSLKKAETINIYFNSIDGWW